MFKFFKKTVESLGKTRKNIVNTFSKFHGKKYLNEDELEELEVALFQSDLDFETVELVVDRFRITKILNNETWEQHFIDILKDIVSFDFKARDNMSKIYLIIGVNGTGKTTTSAKLCKYLKNKGNKVMLVGADTYRAAAINQLKVWAKKIDVRFISNESTKDPASIVFDGITAGLKEDYDSIIIDTAGRLHNSDNLMKELEKIYRIASRFNESIEVILTVDSNVGQNGINQVMDFNKFISINSLVLTKMDGTAKGGIAVSLIKKLKIPISFIGVGESENDLVEFDLNAYLTALVENN
jgi:fused signal recognition particle receptor